MNKKFVKALAVLSVGSILSANTIYAAEPIAYKNETIYVNKEANEVTDKTVSVWVNNDKNKDIKDKSDLKDIKNLENDEKIVPKDGFIGIKSNEKDFYYQGKTDKDLPVDVEISYELDGKEVSYDDLQGANGRLKVTIKAKNKISEKARNSNKNIYAPYLVLTEISFSEDQVENIKADSAKVIKDGKNQIVTSVLTPGLRENFDGILDEDKLDKLKDEISLEMDVKNYNPSEVYAVITNEIFQDGKNMGSIDELENGIDELTKNSDKLVDASGKLKDGSTKISTGLSDLSDGAGKLEDGSARLKSSFDQMAQAFSTLPEQIKPVTGAVSKLNQGGESLNSGINQYTAGLSEINANMDKLNEVARGIEKGTTDLDGGLAKLSSGSSELRKKLSEASGGSDVTEFAESLKTLSVGLNEFEEKLVPMAEG